MAVSRSELVEIGGGFRLPDVMEQSGAELVEVGTTNRTRRSDFERAVAAHGERLALLLKVHQSNFRITGFTESVGVEELVGLGPPLVVDIGSGLLDAACPWLRGRPAAVAGGRAGGPPDAAGRGRPGDVLRRQAARWTAGRDPGRAPRPGRALRRASPGPGAATGRPRARPRCRTLALAYLDRRGDDIPLWRMATVPVDELRRRAAAARPRDRWSTSTAVPGGGTLPGRGAPVGRGRAATATAPPRCGPRTRRSSPGWRTAPRCSTCAPSTRRTTDARPGGGAHCGHRPADARRTPARRAPADAGPGGRR